jgi:hypothetical protein
VPLLQARQTSLPLGSLWFGFTMIVAVSSAQEHQPRLGELNLPNGPVTRLASPDGSHILYGVPYQIGANDTPQLWIEDTRTHQKHMLLSVGGTLTAVWSAGGSAFSVQDRRASDSTRAFIYDAKNLQRLDLGDRILASDPSARAFAPGHDYFDVERWQGTEQVAVRFHGHTDQQPVVCFDFRYRVSRSGAVEKRSQRVVPLDDKNSCND